MMGLTTTFEDRLNVARPAEAELKTILEEHGRVVIPFGQEHTLSQAEHAKLRHIHDDPQVRAIRFKPDYAVFRLKYAGVTYWECKRNTHPGTPNFTIEKACYEELMALHAKGNICIVAFKDTDGTWSANHIEKLRVRQDKSGERHQAHGSHTPYLLIAKNSTLPLSAFLQK